MGKYRYPQAAEVVLNSTYVDDIIDSLDTNDEAIQISRDISELIRPGGFKIKEWFISNDKSMNTEISQTKADDCRDIETTNTIHFGSTRITKDQQEDGGKVLGMTWNKQEDSFHFNVKLNFSEKKRKKRSSPDICQSEIGQILPHQMTKRQILSQVNGFYDPLGLASPVIIAAKIMMTELWKIEGLGWDDSIPANECHKWMNYFRQLFEVEHISFKRCIKPINAVGNPISVTFGDASEDAYGAVSYVRWKLTNGKFASRLVAAKSRVKPKNKVTMVRMELNGAVIASRLQDFISKHLRYNFERTYFILDSAIVHAMTKKESYGFNTYAAVRIGEIQTKSDKDDWHWVEGSLNIADWVTRPKAPADIGIDSLWQNGPKFLQKSEEEWPIVKSPIATEIPEQKKEAVIHIAQMKEETLLDRIDTNRFSKWEKLLATTTTVLNLYRKYGKSVNFKNKTTKSIAQQMWLQEAQLSLEEKMKNGSLVKLCPRYEDGLIVVGGRVERWNQATWNRQSFILLPADHRVSWLIAEWEHRRSGHIGVASTVAKTRSNFWIIGARKLVKSIISKCYGCRYRLKCIASQVMSPLPEERLKPAPVFHTTGIDYFGPFLLQGEVQKRTRRKGYGVIFTCFVSRAIYLDVTPDYSTDSFLQVLRRFATMRGWPAKFYSDQGTQLVGASNELKEAVAGISKQELQRLCAEKDVQWEFSTADGPWTNGVTESLVKSAKKSIEGAIGCQVLTFSQAQTVFFESAELVNGRPIGQHPTDPEDGAYLCPNDLILGRSSSAIPQGPFKNGKNTRTFFFIQQIIENFWIKWTRDYFPSLLVQPKWHTAQRDMAVNDVVIIKDNDLLRGEWKIGRVVKTFESKDGKVRKVDVMHRGNVDGKQSLTIERPVQNLVVIVPVEEQ